MGKNYISGCDSGHRLWNCPDQITARICVEYFTIGHPRLIDSDSPTVLALFTGVVATWWVGLPLGLGLAAAARIGRWPKLRARDLLRPAGKLLALMLIVAGIAGSPGVAAANAGLFQLAGPLGCNVPPDKHTAFLADAWAHSGSYLAGIVGGIVLCVNTWRRRLALASEADNSTLPKGKTKMSLALAAIVMAGLPARATDSPPDYRGRQFVGFEALSSFVERKEAGGDKIVFASPVIHADINFNEVVISWNADLHADSHLEVTAQAIYPQGPTKYYNLGVWSKDRDRGPRHSQAGQHDSDGDVSTDTLILGRPAKDLQVRVTISKPANSLHKAIKFLGVSLADTNVTPAPLAARQEAWGRLVPVPERSQMPYPNGNTLCSPATVSMILGYWAQDLKRPDLDQPVPEIADAIYDSQWHGTGNWPFNMAYAGSFNRMRAYVTRLSDIAELEAWIARNLPVGLSLDYDRLRAKGPGPNGHLVVLVGFTESGDPIINDPGTSEHVRKTFPRKNLIDAWACSRNTVYLVYPEQTTLPIDRYGHWDSPLTRYRPPPTSQ